MGGVATQVRIVEEDGTIKELINRLNIDNLIAKGNEKIGYQIEGGSQFLTPAFIKSLGNHGEGNIIWNICVPRKHN